MAVAVCESTVLDDFKNILPMLSAVSLPAHLGVLSPTNGGCWPMNEEPAGSWGTVGHLS